MKHLFKHWWEDAMLAALVGAGVVGTVWYVWHELARAGVCR